MTPPTDALDDLIATALTARRTLRVAIATALAGVFVRVHHTRLIARAIAQPFAIDEITRSDALVFAAGVADMVVVLVALVSLARFTGRAYETSLAIGVPRLRYTANAARWSFAIPIVHLVKPLLVLRALAIATLHHDLPPPAPRARTDATDGYRDNAIEPVSAVIHGPRPPVLLFWLAWVCAQISARSADALALRADPASTRIGAVRLDLLAGALTVVALLLALRVVRGLDAAIREYHRRARFAPSPDAPATPSTA